MIGKYKVFDCTLREVGYQTGWNFTKEFCRKVYEFAQGKGIDYVELGFFHSEEADPEKGSFRYCSTKVDEINEIFKSSKNITKLSAMRDIQRPLAKLCKRSDSVVDTLRILTRSHETKLDLLDRQIDEALEFGYEVYVNFTSAGFNTIEQNKQFAEFAKSKGVGVIVFADTESVMTEQYVIDTIKVVHEAGLLVGTHLHDKNGTAAQLAEIALSHGTDIIDVTHLGLGGKWRDGNLTMEYLLRRLNVNGGYEETIVKNDLIEQLIMFSSQSVAE